MRDGLAFLAPAHAGFLTGIPQDQLPNRREYSRYSGLAARLTRGVDGYQQLGQPERWSRS